MKSAHLLLTSPLFTAIDLFNFNYDDKKGKAVEPFMQLFGTGAPTTSEEVPTGIVFGCDNCYAYAGVSFVFK
jgi:hypothetical protein